MIPLHPIDKNDAYDKIALKIEDTINKMGGKLDDYRKAGQSEEDPEELL